MKTYFIKYKCFMRLICRFYLSIIKGYNIIYSNNSMIDLIVYNYIVIIFKLKSEG